MNEKKELLILGNGPSRETSEGIKFLNNWKGEIWGCNWIFKDYYNLPRLDLISGDSVAIIPAYKFREENNLDFKILAKFDIPGLTDTGKIEKIDIFHDYKMCTGLMLMIYAKALGYEKIYTIGMDLGGKDIYQHFSKHPVPLEKTNKGKWLIRFRRYKDILGEEEFRNSFEFIGNKSMDWICNDRPIKEHVATYLVSKKNNKDEKRKVLIVGNGESRRRYQGFLEKWDGEIWGCNWFGKEAGKLPNKDKVTRLGTVHSELLETYDKIRKESGLDYTFYVKKKDDERIKDIKNVKEFSLKQGWATGFMLILQAFSEGYKFIYIMGFDFGGKDIYHKDPLEGSNFVKQFQEIMKMYGRRKIRFIGKKPKWFNKMPLKGVKN